MTLGCVAGRTQRPKSSQGRELVVCGRRVPVDAPVILWHQAPYYDAYSIEPRFESGRKEPIRGLRYGPVRTFDGSDLEQRLRAEPNDLETLREAVDLFVLHYDVCGTSRTCFDVLQDRRKLSVHFLLDLDGTIYQTLDLKERAWHAAHANSRSIGIEIAQIGAWPVGDETLERWYAHDDEGAYVTLPERVARGELPPDLEARPARPQLIQGEIHGMPLLQYDFTRPQYDSLVALTSTLCRVFPRLAPDAPRDANGAVRTDRLTAEEYAAHRGLIGHYHLTTSKIDPGPAFDWERLVAGVVTTG